MCVQCNDRERDICTEALLPLAPPKQLAIVSKLLQRERNPEMNFRGAGERTRATGGFTRKKERRSCVRRLISRHSAVAAAAAPALFNLLFVCVALRPPKGAKCRGELTRGRRLQIERPALRRAHGLKKQRAAHHTRARGSDAAGSFSGAGQMRRAGLQAIVQAHKHTHTQHIRDGDGGWGRETERGRGWEEEGGGGETGAERERDTHTIDPMLWIGTRARRAASSSSSPAAAAASGRACMNFVGGGCVCARNKERPSLRAQIYKRSGVCKKKSKRP